MTVMSNKAVKIYPGSRALFGLSAKNLAQAVISILVLSVVEGFEFVSDCVLRILSTDANQPEWFIE